MHLTLFYPQPSLQPDICHPETLYELDEPESQRPGETTTLNDKNPKENRCLFFPTLSISCKPQNHIPSGRGTTTWVGGPESIQLPLPSLSSSPVPDSNRRQPRYLVDVEGGSRI